MVPPQAGEKCFYFAYGSNMNRGRMMKRGASFTTLQAARLDDYQFSFNLKLEKGAAVANIEPKPGSSVFGVLYACTEDTLRVLDAYERVQAGLYARRAITVQTKSGGLYEAITYVGCEANIDPSNSTPINNDYLDHILYGKPLLPAHYFQFLQDFRTRCAIQPPSAERVFEKEIYSRVFTLNV